MENLTEIFSKENDNRKTSKTIESIIFNIIFKHVQDLVFIMKVEEGPSFRYIFANEAACKHAGLNKSFVGKTLEEVMPFDRALPIQLEYEKALKSKKYTAFFDEFPTSSGKVIYGQSNLTPVQDEEGVTRYIVSVTRDITESISENKRLIESEQRYRSIVDHNLDGIFSVDLHGDILEVNPAGQVLTGYSSVQLTNRSFLQFIHEKDHAHFQAIFDKTKRGYPLETLDCRFIHRKGFQLLLQIKTVPIVINTEIQGIYVILRDISEQAKSAETIKYMAFHDQLTGLLNRRALIEDITEQISISKQNRTEFALLSIDLDRFKQLNDTLGHLAGDEILKKVAERLIEVNYENCKIYRQGGDEFIILLQQSNRPDAGKYAQSILSQFKHSFYLNSHEYYITPSIGISLYPNDGKEADTLIQKADEALFRVKEKGKAHFQFYCAEGSSLLVNVITLETHLRKAIERQELSLYYQPQIDLETDEISSFEALIRWHNQELGFISPVEFIPLAEDTGLIIPIGNWVIETACKQIYNWTEIGKKEVRIAINISPRQFQQPAFVQVIRDSIKKYGIKPSLLEIEITEGAMQDTAEAIPILNDLKKLGVTIAVDDFGTGYSSLNYIKQFPIDVLKIDQSFVKDVLLNEKDQAITTTIIHLANSLGMEVIAEGVEEAEQVEFLKRTNCHKAQGYYFSKPFSAEDITAKYFPK
ncbi:EAL domain-containing protein [Cytobacillus spongiae]|uniref:sensor domain-containing protein n=1 Tax=Cytobacillus spongiae TaxID=2901381 RepID=UPI001F1EF3A0|nr:GGDEF and EAL domain-containing protein [Cytobacillus spongiae]UII57218.1 EAL domain-containing protein [Cytobacillus spongiae]